MKRIVGIIILFLVAWIVVKGLRGNAPTEEVASRKETIVIWGWPPIDEGLKKVIKDFEAKHPQIKVELIMMGFGDVHTKLLTSIAAKSGAPDITMIDVSNIGKFSAKQGLTNLLEQPYDAAKYKKEFVKYKWSQALTDGRLVALPWDIGPAGIFYRRDFFAESGLPSDPEQLEKEIKTWEDYLAVGKKVVRTEKRWLIGGADAVVSVYMNSGNYFDNKNKISVNSSKAIRMAEVSKKIRDLGYDARQKRFSPEWQTLIKKGNVASEIAGCWFGGSLKSWISSDGDQKWGVIPTPEGAYNQGGSFLAIPEQSKHKKAAWEFIEFALCQPENINEIYKKIDTFPALMTAWKDPLYDEGDSYFTEQKVRQLFIKVAQKIPAFNSNRNDALAADITLAWVRKMLDEGLGAKKALDGAAKEIQSRID